jgi:hypothetical protein
MRRSRLLLACVIVLWYLVLGLVFLVVRPELAYSFGHWLHPFGRDLPSLTVDFSLPVLGPEISSLDPSYRPVFWLVWGALAAPPAILMGYAWRVSERLALLEAAVYGGAAYLLATLAVSIMLALGLWLPFSAA